MQFNSVGSNDYTTAANAVMKNVDSIFDINRATGADYTKQAQTVIESRSRERQAVNKVKADNKLAKLMGKDQHKMTKIELDSDKAVKAAKRPAQRMAGFLGAVSTLNTAYATKRFNDEDKAERAEALRRQDARDAKWEKLQRESIEAQNKPRPLSPELQKLYDELNIKPPGGNTLPGSSTTPTGQKDDPSVPQTPPKVLPTQTKKSGKGKTVSELVRFAEGTLGDKGFTTMFGGGQFTDMSRHPNSPVPTPWGTKSEAAGAFQFMKPTWDRTKAALNLPDFSRESQIKGGRWLMQQRDVDPDMVITSKDQLRVVMDKLAPEWAGLPYSGKGVNGGGYGSSYYGQGGKSLDEMWSFHQS